MTDCGKQKTRCIRKITLSGPVRCVSLPDEANCSRRKLSESHNKSSSTRTQEAERERAFRSVVRGQGISSRLTRLTACLCFHLWGRSVTDHVTAPDPQRAVQTDPDPQRAIQPDPDPQRAVQPDPDPQRGVQTDPDPQRGVQPDPDPQRGVQPVPRPTACNKGRPRPTECSTARPRPTSFNTHRPRPTACNTARPRRTACNTIRPRPTACSTVRPRPAACNTVRPRPTDYRRKSPLKEKAEKRMFSFSSKTGIQRYKDIY